MFVQCLFVLFGCCLCDCCLCLFCDCVVECVVAGEFVVGAQKQIKQKK